MDSAGTAMQLGGLGLKIGGAIGQGNAAKAAGQYEAAQLRQRANIELGTGAAAGAEQAARGAQVAGAAKAIGAASGAGGGPTISAIMGGINQRTAGLQGLELWKGKVGETQDINAANAAIMRGNNAQRASIIGALGTGLSDFGKFASKRWGGTSILDDERDV